MAGDLPSYADLTQTRAWTGTLPQRVAAPSDPLESQRYREAAVLGVGGMGKVVLARDQRIGREVAVKQLRADRELGAAERDRFLREAHIQGQLEHPSIVPVYDIDQRDDGTTFFTMRRVLGHTLQAVLEGSAHSQRELLQAFGTVCLAIDYAHSRGVVHRDLKPANIMLGDFGEVYVLDWGLARVVDAGTEDPASRLSSPGVGMGTPLYMAPEQMTDPNVGPGADVFALGAILFEILTRQSLRDPRAVAVPIDARATVRAPDRAVAPELEAICLRATQDEPEDRFPSARALHDAIARFLEGDRELEQRRALAAGHAARAAEALEHATTAADPERERGIAMRELLRALALDPTNRDHVAMLGEIMATPPRDAPPEVERRIAAYSEEVVRSGVRHSVYATLAWFLFLPGILALGLRRVDYMLWIAIPIALTVGLSWLASRQRPIRRPFQVAAILAYLAANLAASRLFGPFIVVPTIMASTVNLLQTHPDRLLRQLMLIGASVVIVTVPLLEWVGVLPLSYAFEDGGLAVLPQMTSFTPGATYLILTLASLGIAIVPALFIARLRDALSEAQRRELVMGWHFRRLGADLIRANAR